MKLFLNVYAGNGGSSASGRGGDSSSKPQGMPRDRNLRMSRGKASEIRDVLTNPRKIDRRSQGIRRDLRSIGARK